MLLCKKLGTPFNSLKINKVYLHLCIHTEKHFIKNLLIVYSSSQNLLHLQSISIFENKEVSLHKQSKFIILINKSQLLGKGKNSDGT